MHKYPYAVYDTEVSTRNPRGFAASPFFPGNTLVLGGYKDSAGVYQFPTATGFPVDHGVIVGANLKFDLLWAARVLATTPARLVRGRRIWDVCTVEYLLQRQRVRMPSLEKCAELRGIATRKHALSDDIKAGVCPSAVRFDLLSDYHKQDLELTHEVFVSQFIEAQQSGMLPLIWSQMQAIVATAEMEHNGVSIDVHELSRLREKYATAVSAVLGAVSRQIVDINKYGLCQYITDMSSGTVVADLLGSNKHLSLTLFGGFYEVKVKQVIGTYKNGKPKYKTVNEVRKYEGPCDPSKHGATMTKLGTYTVDDDVLKSIVTDMSVIFWARDLARHVREYRAAMKQITVYVDGVAESIWPDGKVHCNFNHNVTLTGRLSCSAPNLQNQTDGDIKRVFIPSTPGGLFIEFDYSQLEVVGLAVLSDDKQLLKDISEGVDIHTALYEDMYHRTPTTAERKAFKPLTFGLIYGAGARTMAQNSGIPLGDAKLFIRTFYARYPAVKSYHEGLMEQAKINRQSTTEKTPKGLPVGKYIYRLFTGREFEFREYDSIYIPGGGTAFSPTELKNWPVQGWSTGDVVPLMLGHVVEKITSSKWYGIILPKLTVHDSIMFEITKPELLDEARNYLVELMSNTRQVIIDTFKVDIGIDLKTEHKVGRNWKDMTDA